MKKAIIIAALSALLLSGCGKTLLTVWVPETESFYLSALESYAAEHEDVELQIEEFRDYDALQAKLEADPDNGPDLILLNSLQSGIDPLKTASSESLCPLDDTTDDGLIPALQEAGIINGERYWLPLSWNILQAYTSEDVLNEQAYDVDDLYAALMEESGRMEDSSEYCAASLNLARADVMNLFTEIMDVRLFEERIVSVDQQALHKAADFVRMFYDDMPKISSTAKKYNNDLAGAAEHFSFLLENYPFMNNLRYYQSVYPDITGKAIAFVPFADKDGGITAQIIHYGAVSAGTKYPDEAEALLKYLSEAPVSMDFSKYGKELVYAPAGVEVYAQAVEELSVEMGPGPNGPVASLNDKNADLLGQLPDRISSAVIPNPTLGGIIQECMEPYLRRQEEFGSCCDKLTRRLESYLAE